MKNETDIRELKGLTIAQTRRLKNTGGHAWIVPSQYGTGRYRVSLDPERTCCTCPDFDHSHMCKHIFAARYASRPGLTDELPRTRIMRPTYSQSSWHAYDQAQQNETEHVEQLLMELLQGIPETPYGGRGKYPLQMRDLIYAACMKVYGGKSGRRSHTSLRRCRQRGLIQRAPHHSAVSQMMVKDELTPILYALITESAKPVAALETQYAIDATGLQTTHYGRWLQEKFSPRRRDWIKMHVAVGCKTNIIVGVRITESNVHDTVMLPEIFKEVLENHKIAEFSCDKGYLSQKNLHIIEAAGVKAFIPFKVDSTPNGSEVWKRLYHQFHFNYPAWAKSYNQRSNSEATFGALKRLLGGKLRSRKFRSRVNEALCMTLVFNLIVVTKQMYMMGIQPEFPSVEVDDPSEERVLH